MNATRYHYHRRQGHTASTALALARLDAGAFHDSDATFTLPAYPGWTFRAEIEFDEYGDTDFYGTLSNTYKPGAIRTDNHADPGYYAVRYFHPANPVADTLPYFRRRYARHDAYRKATEQVQEDMRRAAEAELYTVQVTAEGPNGEHGTCTLCGIEDEYPFPYASDVARTELAHEAAAEAEERYYASAARRLNTSPEILRYG